MTAGWCVYLGVQWWRGVSQSMMAYTGSPTLTTPGLSTTSIRPKQGFGLFSSNTHRYLATQPSHTTRLPSDHVSFSYRKDKIKFSLPIYSI